MKTTRTPGNTPVSELLGERTFARVAADAPIAEAATAFAGCPHARVLYVVDGAGALQGSIALSVLAQHLFPHRHAPRVHGRHLMRALVTERAGDLAQRRPLLARADEPAGTVLDRMLGKGVEELPVVDHADRLVGAISLVDLLGLAPAR